MLSPDFEGTVGFSKSMAEKRGKPMAAICQLEAKTDVTEFTPILKTMAEFAFGVALH
jgi:hypothetical protein